MDDYCCLTVIGRANETESAFKSRLIEFWTHMLRHHPDDYEQVYAESVAFDRSQDRVTRQYMVEERVVTLLETLLGRAEIEFTPVDRDDRYGKYEASSAEWFQLDH